MRISTAVRYAFGAVGAAAVFAGCSSGGGPQTGFAPFGTTQPNLTQSALRARPQTRTTLYYLVDLGTLGGYTSFGNSVNNRGWSGGTAYLHGNAVFHAVLWRAGRATDLGTLGGANSAILYPIKNDRGELDGVSEGTALDPLNENFCGYGTGHVCLGFDWRGGIMKPLATLGGNNAQATGANNHGQIAGVAETSTMDSSCQPPQQLIYNGVIWQKNGMPTALPPYSGDAVSVALAINGRGEAVGSSGACGNLAYVPASLHALLWRGRKVIDLGNLGGTENNVAYAVNNRGEIAGQSSLPGNTATHAFLWKKGVMSDLGTLPGDVSSAAFGMNDKGQIVGYSCNASGGCRAFIWQNGAMTDLNGLIPPRSKLYLFAGSDINEHGQIICNAIDTKKAGVVRAALLLPANRRAVLPGGAASARVTLPEGLQMKLQLGVGRRPFAAP